jgi:hypothetical protein
MHIFYKNIDFVIYLKIDTYKKMVHLHNFDWTTYAINIVNPYSLPDLPKKRDNSLYLLYVYCYSFHNWLNKHNNGKYNSNEIKKLKKEIKQKIIDDRKQYCIKGSWNIVNKYICMEHGAGLPWDGTKLSEIQNYNAQNLFFDPSSTINAAINVMTFFVDQFGKLAKNIKNSPQHYNKMAKRINNFSPNKPRTKQIEIKEIWDKYDQNLSTIKKFIMFFTTKKVRLYHLIKDYSEFYSYNNLFDIPLNIMNTTNNFYNSEILLIWLFYKIFGNMRMNETRTINRPGHD